MTIVSVLVYIAFNANDSNERMIMWMLVGIATVFLAIIHMVKRDKYGSVATGPVTLRVSPRELIVTAESTDGRDLKSILADEIQDLGIDAGEDRHPDQFEAEIWERVGRNMNPDKVRKQLAKRRAAYDQRLAVRFVQRDTLFANTGGDRLSFGKGLRPEEAYWLCDLLPHVLSR